MRYILLLALCGCSYTYPIGHIENKQLYKVQAGSLSGPTQTMIAIVDTNTHEITFLSPMGGNGILSSVTVAGSIVAGSYFIGRGLEKSHGDQTTINASAAANALGEATSISSPVINVPDPPPAPPIRVRPPFGRAIGHSK